MGCSNVRLLVPGPSATEPGARANNPILSAAAEGTSPANVPIDATSRMHLTGVDLIVERNGSYTLLLTPRTHKQLMPYVLRKKRFRILVDKPRLEATLDPNEQNMDVNKETKLNTEQDNKTNRIPMNQSTIESLEQVASDELNKTEIRLMSGQNIDHGNRNDEDEYVHSDDEGMIEEIITTVEQDKDLECKVKKKIETKKTTSQHPDTHNTITKVVKTEVTEITRTITINDHHDLERAKRELGIDDVNKLLPSSKWTHQSNGSERKEKQNESVKETVTSKDASSVNQTKQIESEKKYILSESTIVGRGPVTETIPSLSSPKSEQKTDIPKKKKKSKFCSCTRSTAVDNEQDQKKKPVSSIEQKAEVLPITTQLVNSTIETQTQGQPLISSDIKQLIVDKKFLLIQYIHTKIFSPSNLFSSNEQDVKASKISSRILDLLRYDRCSSWTQMLEQLKEEYKNYLSDDFIIQPMVNTYESLFIAKQANLLNTFATIHHENDIDNIQENSEYVTIVEKHIHERDDQPNVDIIVKRSTDSMIDKVEQLKQPAEDSPTDKLDDTSIKVLAEKLEQTIEEIQVEESEPITEEIQVEESEPITEEIQTQSLEQTTEELQTDTLDQTIDEAEIDKLGNSTEEEPVEKVINDDGHINKEVNMTDNEVQQSLVTYNEEQLIKILAGVSQHKPITLAEAIAYQYIDIEDPKLGLSDDVIQHIKHLFRPLSDQSISNLIQVQRSGEYVTDINLAETNPFEKLNLTEPYIYQLRHSFEPTLDFSEKEFRLLTETILNNKEQYDQLQFDIARTILPLCDVKDSSVNDISQTDSGYSMTTVTHDSLASKIKIEFEPINQQIPAPPARSDLPENEKIDLDKATQEQLHKYELNHDLIQIIKSDYNVSDKTIGQAILSRELRLDSTDPNDVSRLNSLGIDQSQARILHAFFFPKQTRTIAYSPEPGLFVEAQTTYNPNYPSYKTDTTIIQIQDKQLSSDVLTKQRNLHDDRAPLITSEPRQHSEIAIPLLSAETTSTTILKEAVSLTPTSAAETAIPAATTTTAASLKKRKSSGHGSLLTCFRSKKPKAGTEQQGQTTIQPTVVVNETAVFQQNTARIEEKPIMDYAISPNGKRIYIDIFRDRPGLDMSYKPNDFEDRFILPISKPASEYEQQIIPEIEPITLGSKAIEHEHIDHLESRFTAVQPVDIQLETTSTVVHPAKTEEMTVKKKLSIDLRGAAVKLPEIELVKPGPLPKVSFGRENKVKKVKTKSTGGLCESCFGTKSKTHKKQKESISATIQAPIEQKKIVELEKTDSTSPTILATQINESLPITTKEPILPNVNIDVFRERNLQKNAQNFPQVENRIDETNEQVLLHAKLHDRSSSNEPLTLTSPNATIAVESPLKSFAIQDTSIFSKVNIDTFRERTLHKASENLPKPEEHRDAIIQSLVLRSDEPHYELPTNEFVQQPKETIKTATSTKKDTSIFSQVNIDTFRERTLERGSENHPKPTDNTNATYVTVTSSHEQSHQEFPTNEPVQSSTATMKTITSGIKDASIFSQVNIDTFRERTLEKGSENHPKPTDNTNATYVTVTSSHEQSHQEFPTNEPINSSTATMKTITSGIKDASIFSQVNIDTFRERTLEKGSEMILKPIERADTANINVSASLEESHYESPVGTVKANTAAAKDLSIFSQVNIDTFRERTLEKGSESHAKPVPYVAVTNVTEAPSHEEPHYEFPKNEPVSQRTTAESFVKDASIFSTVNIDSFRERTFEKSSKNSSKIEGPSDVTIGTVVSSEEPHYQLPSSEPVPLLSMPLENEYSTVDRSTYDIPRTIELQQTATSRKAKANEQMINNLPMVSSTIEIKKSSDDILTTKTLQEKVKVGDIAPVTTDLSTKIHGKQTKGKDSSDISKKIKKSKAKKAKLDDKSSLFSTLFCHNKQKSKVPAHKLPPVECGLVTNTQLNSLHRLNDDPLHVPSTNLPQLDIQLPTYKQPEVDMTAGQIKQTSEFTIPALNLTAIPDLQLPEHNRPLLRDSKSDQIKIPKVELPNLPFISNEQAKEKIVMASNVEDSSSIATVSVVKTEMMTPNLSLDGTQISCKPELSSIEQLDTIIDNNSDQVSSVPVLVEKKPNIDFQSQIVSSETKSTLSKSTPIPVTILHDVSTQKSENKELIETRLKPTKKSSSLSLCSCFGNKSDASKTKTQTLEVPKTNLPEINLPNLSSNISSTLKTQRALRAPANDLPSVDLTPKSIESISLPTIHAHDTKLTINQTGTSVPLCEIKNKEEIQVQVPTSTLSIEKQTTEEPITQVDVLKNTGKIQQVKTNQNVSAEVKKSSLFEITAPVINIPELNLSGPSKVDAYLPFTKHEESTPVSEAIQSNSDSGLEAIIASHIHPSSTFGTTTTMEDIRQLPSISSGLGSEISDKLTIKSSTLSDIQMMKPMIQSKELEYDIAHKITINDELRSKLKSKQDQLKTCLENEISHVIIDNNPKPDLKSLEKILTDGIDLIKDKQVSTYDELQLKLNAEHKHDSFVVDSVVRALYCTIEKQGLDNLDKPEFPLAIRDMVRLPAKQTYDTVTYLNKEATPLATIQMTNKSQSPVSIATAQHPATINIEQKPSEQTTKKFDDRAHSCLTCGRGKSKAKLSTLPSSSSTTTSSSSGLLDERHRSQLHVHRNELGTIINNHIQSSQPPIRSFSEHPKEVEKLTRKTLILVTQPKIHSYEEIRNDLKTEYKQTFYLVDPTVDIIRDALNHCDVTQMNERINLDILNSNITQTANLYNNQTGLLTNQEYNALKSNQLSWLQQYLIDNELKEKKLTRKQNKELSKILQRTLEILSTNHVSSWDEVKLQLQREYPKAHDLCNRSVELIKQSQKNGLFHSAQAPNVEEKRRSSFLITDRARQNLKTNRNKLISSLKSLLINHNNLSNDDNELDIYLNKTLDYLEEQKQGQFKNYDDLKQQLKHDFKNNKQDTLIDQIVDVIEQAHATSQFDDVDRSEVQALMKNRLNGKPLIIKEIYVSLPPRISGLKSSNEDSSNCLSTSVNGDRTFNSTIPSHAVARGLSWREANERARILFYRGKHPAIHYNEQAAAFDVRMLLETASGGTQEIPVTDSDVHELLHSCGVQWDGVNIISLVDHSEDVVRAAEQAALKVIREKGIIDLRAPPTTTKDIDIHDDDLDESVVSPAAPNLSS